jgi:hypothetical protein
MFHGVKNHSVRWMTVLRMRCLAVLWSVLLCGCLTRYRQANELARAGKFVEAAELFDQLAKENPADPELPALVETAHQRAVEQALGNARRQRLSGDPKSAQEWFARGLSLRERWNLKLNGALESTVDDEREDATERLRALVIPLAQKGEALTAQALIVRHGFLLEHAELTALRTELDRLALESGKDSCKRLRAAASAAEPHWTNLVAHYCEHFLADAPRRWPLVETFGAQLRTTVAVSQLSDALAGQLQATVLKPLYEGPWYSPGGTQTGQLAIGGAVALQSRERVVQLQAGWTERVPYIENVTKTFEEQVPVNECEVYEENQTINSVSVKVQKTKTVTKTKTKKYQKVVPETRWRDVPRSFEYQALQVERSQSYAVRAELIIAGQSTASAGRDTSDALSGYAHDVVFAEANVHPQRPEFPAPEGWLSARGAELAANLAESQADGWRARYCRTGAYDLEAAARCARAVSKLPAEATQALRQALGADAMLAPALLRAAAQLPSAR